MEKNTNQTIEFSTRNGNEAMIVENPLNGQKVDLMPLFNYMESKKDWYAVEVAQPTLLANVVSDIMEHQHDLLTELSEEARCGVSFSSDVLLNYNLAIQNANNLEKVFKSMTIKKDRYTHQEVENIIQNPLNGKTINTEPLFRFLNRDFEETANVIEHTANQTDKENPDLDLTMATDLLRDLANCIKEMEA
jgi:hypothetical protein